jgi:hypothetical protein
MMTEDEIQQIADSIHDAEEYLQLAVMKFFAKHRNDSDPQLMFLGLEMALLRHAARVAVIMRDVCGAQNTKKFFIKEARHQYVDAGKYLSEKPMPKPPRKPSLKIVK